jgi:hypothetical protein
MPTAGAKNANPMPSAGSDEPGEMDTSTAISNAPSKRSEVGIQYCPPRSGSSAVSTRPRSSGSSVTCSGPTPAADHPIQLASVSAHFGTKWVQTSGGGAASDAASGSMSSGSASAGSDRESVSAPTAASPGDVSRSIANVPHATKTTASIVEVAPVTKARIRNRLPSVAETLPRRSWLRRLWHSSSHQNRRVCSCLITARPWLRTSADVPETR